MRVILIIILLLLVFVIGNDNKEIGQPKLVRDSIYDMDGNLHIYEKLIFDGK